ncbi:MAG: hypothetical protein HKM05_07525 [Spirochaetales bacterium]|nr:hypothetical protein [Spirochaetales bacterium]
MKFLNGLLLLIFLTPALFAQSHQTEKTAVLDGEPIEFHLGELVKLQVPLQTRFTKAVEIEIQVPREIFDRHANLAVSLYQNPEGAPTTEERIAWEVLPIASHFYLDVPLIANAHLLASVDTAVVKRATFPLFLSIQALDSSGETHDPAVFHVSCHWLSTNLGGFLLRTPNLSPELRQQLKILINGHKETSEGVIYLDPGVYTVHLSLPGYKSQNLNMAVRPAKITELSAVLAEDTPYVTFEAPTGTQILLDGKLVPPSAWNSLAVSKGIHTVQFTIGGYQVADNFEITRGGRHKVSLQMQIAFEEE